MKMRQTFEQSGYEPVAWNEQTALVRNADGNYELFAVSDNDLDVLEVDGRAYAFARQATQSDVIDFFIL